jgi:PAS domain S-box-containing protein
MSGAGSGQVEQARTDGRGVSATPTGDGGPVAQPASLIGQTQLLELVPDAFVAVGSGGEIVLANSRAEELFGYRREEMVGRPVEMLMPATAARAHRSHRAGYFAAPAPRSMRVGLELAGRRRDGSEFPVEIMLSSITLGSRQLAAAGVRDISERLAAFSEKERLAAETGKERLAAATGKERLAAEAEKERLAAETERERLTVEAERKRLAAETGKERLAAETEKERLAAETEKDRLAAEAEKERLAAETEKDRLAAEIEKERLAAETGRERLAAEAERERLATETGRERLAAEAERERLATETGKERLAAETEKERLAAETGQERLAAETEKERLAAETGQEHQEAEAEKERLLNQLHHARRLESLGELAGGIAHDFNNLLAVIINYAGFVAEDLDATAQAENEEKRRAMRADVEQISLAAERAALLTHQLLAFARREVVQPDIVDVNAVVTNVGKLLKRTLGEHIELRTALAPALRSSVVIDPGQLEQILLNLAVNTRDAMPEGGTLTIDTTIVELPESEMVAEGELSPGPNIRLRVSDNGEGMPKEVAERAFDPFFTTKAPGQGTGLGLATVSGIIQQAGGRARIYSEPGIGTTFTALLPTTDQTPSRSPTQNDSETARGEETILLVEDEDALREVARRILAGGGYRVIVAANGAEALAAVAEWPDSIDLLLTDVVMPQMHGPELAEQIKRAQPSIRVMFMSGFAQPILDSGGHLDPGVILVEKPFSGPTLLAKVSHMLNRNLPGT